MLALGRRTVTCLISAVTHCVQVIGNSPVWNGSGRLRPEHCQHSALPTNVDVLNEAQTPWRILSPSWPLTIESTLGTLLEVARPDPKPTSKSQATLKQLDSEGSILLRFPVHDPSHNECTMGQPHRSACYPAISSIGCLAAQGLHCTAVDLVFLFSVCLLRLLLVVHDLWIGSGLGAS